MTGIHVAVTHRGETREVASEDDNRRIAETERWFLARGTPHLIEGYSATGDVFTRAAPALTLLFVASVAGARNREWSLVANLIAVLIGFGVLLGIWAIANRVRGRRLLQRPDTVGPAELTVFVVGPTLVQLLSGQPRAASVTFVSLLTLLGAVYVVTSYGLLPMSRWALAKTVTEVRAVTGLVARALPLLLLIQIVLFINTEMWQVAAALTGPFLAVMVVLFFVVGVTFLCTRLPGEIGRLASFDSAGSLAALCEDTPVAGARVGDGALDPPPLSRRQRGNLLLVALFSQGIQVVVVVLVLGLFFVVLGLFAIGPAVLDSWLGSEGDVLVDFTLWGQRVLLTAELLKLSVFLAAFSGLYFSVVLVTDDTYRREFLDAVLTELRQTLAVRAAYLALRPRPVAAPSP